MGIGGAPRPPRASPARCARRPLTLKRRGLVGGGLRGGGVLPCSPAAPLLWIPASAGMTEGGGHWGEGDIV